MGSELKDIFVPHITEEDIELGNHTSYAFESDEEAAEYLRKMETEPHPWNNIVTDESLRAMTETPEKSVWVVPYGAQFWPQWSASVAMAKVIPQTSLAREPYQWDGAPTNLGLAVIPTPVLPDAWGVGFSSEELEQWSDVRSRETIVEAYAAADGDQRALLGAGRRNGY